MNKYKKYLKGLIKKNNNDIELNKYELALVEAYELIKDSFTDAFETIEPLIELVLKSDSMLVDKSTIGYSLYTCPNCKENNIYDNENYNFCSNCGQALDWSNDNG